MNASLSEQRISESVTIINERGLHARASAKFVTMVNRLPDGFKVFVSKDDQKVTGNSIMGLMMLGAARNSSVIIHVEYAHNSEEARIILLRLKGLIMDGFGED